MATGSDWVHIGIMVRGDLRAPELGRGILSALISCVPEWSPEKHSDHEPILNEFDPANIDAALSCWTSNFLWKRSKGRVEGSAWFSSHLHSAIFLDMSVSVFDSDRLGSLVRALAALVFVELVYVDAKCKTIDSAVRPFVTKKFFGLSTVVLRNGLPDLPWAIWFGPAYTDLIGRTVLASAPAYRVECGGLPGIQLSQRPEDSCLRGAIVLDAKNRLREHIGQDVFAGSPTVRVPTFGF